MTTAPALGVQETFGENVHTRTRVVVGSGEARGHTLLPELYRVGWSRFRRADPGHLRPHVHRGAFEICLIVDGEVEWETSGHVAIVRSGDLYVTRPDQRTAGSTPPCTRARSTG